METSDFELLPDVTSQLEQEHVINGRKEIAEHRLRAVQKLGYKFPIFRAMKAGLAGEDLLPDTSGEASLAIEPISIETALKYRLNEYYSLTNIAWEHAKHSMINDPTLSWTFDIEVARRMAAYYANLHKQKSVIISAQGTPLPLVGNFSELKPNFVISVPILAEIRNSWPSEQSKVENEAVTFGIFPVSLYKIVEEVE